MSTERTIGGLVAVSCKIIMKDDSLERTRPRNRTVYHTPQAFNWYGLKLALIISHTLVDPFTLPLPSIPTAFTKGESAGLPAISKSVAPWT